MSDSYIVDLVYFCADIFLLSVLVQSSNYIGESADK